MLQPAFAQARFADVDGWMVTAGVRSSSGAGRPFLVFFRLPLGAAVVASLFGRFLAFLGSFLHNSFTNKGLAAFGTNLPCGYGLIGISNGGKKFTQETEESRFGIVYLFPARQEFACDEESNY
jgi:hypothetical protein